MERDEATMTRRSLLVGGAGLFALGGIPGAFAKLPAGGFKGLIGNASDGALDKLSEPGAFYADTAVRILLPGANGKLASKLFGVGDRQARWLIVGEAPGAEEDQRGEPFVGRAGRLLDSMLLAIGLTHPDMFSGVASFSAALQIANNPAWGGIDMAAALANADAINELDLLWIGCGTEDRLFDVNKSFSEQLTKAGV